MEKQICELFAGVGGFRLGLNRLQSGWKTVWFSQWEPGARTQWAFDCYVQHFGDSVDINGEYHTCEDISNVDKHSIPDHTLLVGGFPCQDFSVAGKRLGFNSKKDDKRQARKDDEPSEESRGKLYFWMKEVIDIVKPKIFVAENVKGLVNLGNVKDVIQRDFASADGNGYIVLPPQVLHAGNYGVPESRERVIFIGVRRDALNAKALKALDSEFIPEEYNPYPRPTHSASMHDESLLPLVTTYDVLKNLREPEFTQDESQKVYSKAKYLGNGSQGQIEIKLDGLGPTIRSEHHGNIEFRRLSYNHGGKHFNELKRGMKERRLTPRECAMIQTFPPDYQFVANGGYWGGKHISASGAYKIIGNAVPPVLAFQIATRIQDLWSKFFD